MALRVDLVVESDGILLEWVNVRLDLFRLVLEAVGQRRRLVVECVDRCLDQDPLDLLLDDHRGRPVEQNRVQQHIPSHLQVLLLHLLDLEFLRPRQVRIRNLPLVHFLQSEDLGLQVPLRLEHLLHLQI